MRPATLLLLTLGAGCATRHALIGKVVDRNGDPMDRVIVSVEPGGVEILTDQDGSFAVDYLRDAQGERIRLKRRTDYTLEAFRTGYQPGVAEVAYRRGELQVSPITMVEDTIEVSAGNHVIDPERATRAGSTGATYEGE
jgi:hypothetical protein